MVQCFLGSVVGECFEVDDLALLYTYRMHFEDYIKNFRMLGLCADNLDRNELELLSYPNQ